MSESEKEPEWSPTANQQQRAQRSLAILAKRQVPVLRDPVLHLDDDESVSIRTGEEIARRALVLWVVVLRSRGIPHEEALGLMDSLKLWDAASPNETEFLREESPDEDECQRLTWELESLWVLLWSLGHLENLDWPSDMCAVPQLVPILKKAETDPNFVLEANGRVRDKTEILDANDLTMRIHWAIRDAWIKGGFLPMNLDWSRDYELARVETCPGVGVVERRHRTLNWLTQFNDSDWDNVDTPT